MYRSIYNAVHPLKLITPHETDLIRPNRYILLQPRYNGLIARFKNI